ncbi:MAG: four-carbon acid sugar kinase family protein [Chloroflexota bacterium]
MKLSEILAGKPPEHHIPGARSQIRQSLIDSGKRLAVIEDDPTGTQTVHGVNIFMTWSVAMLRKAIASGAIFFISTNSRSLSPDEARRISYEVGRNLREATSKEGTGILLASRSDSTLRGHFPYEVDALTSGLKMKPDGIIIAPAFFEAGRYTIDDIQWVEQGGELVPVHETEYARDPVFGFKNSNMKAWVTEKMGGTVNGEDVWSISLDLLRENGPQEVAERLLAASNGRPIIVNAAGYDDLEVMALGIIEAEKKGKSFVYRCAASFLKARGGFEDKPFLTYKDLNTARGPGLIIVGSYVEKTSNQLKQLLASGLAYGIELRVSELHNLDSRQTEVESVANAVNEKLAAGVTTVVYTSRKLHITPGQNFQEFGKYILQSLCEVVGRTQVRPAYLIAKGSTTGFELARNALNNEQALVLGQIISGVPVLRLGAGARWANLPYIVFPGNVGDENALCKVVETFPQ